MRYFIEIISRNDLVLPSEPYDFEIGAESGALKEYCVFCKTTLSEEKKWMERSLLNAMRVSLYMHGRVRLIHCGRCRKSPCAEILKMWLTTQGPLQIETVILNINAPFTQKNVAGIVASSL